jgi:hypothetical protein
LGEWDGGIAESVGGARMNCPGVGFVGGERVANVLRVHRGDSHPGNRFAACSSLRGLPSGRDAPADFCCHDRRDATVSMASRLPMLCRIALSACAPNHSPERIMINTSLSHV